MMNTKICLIIVLLTAFCGTAVLAQQPQKNDLKLRVKITTAGQSFEQLTYVKGVRQRSEMTMAGGMATITQCDLKRTVQLNVPAKTYLITNNATPTTEATTNAPATAPLIPENTTPKPKRGGIITTVNNINDTGERKEMFGFTARHIKTVMTTETSPDACNQTKMRIESDGWYIDFADNGGCAETFHNPQRPTAYQRPQCMDEYRAKTIGKGRLGYPVLVTTKIFNETGEPMTMTQEVVELSRAQLDAALFEIPADYTEAKDYAQLAGVAANLRQTAVPAQNPAQSDAIQRAAATAPAPTNVAVGAKKPGVVRIGVVQPKAQMEQGNNGTDVATPIRNLVVSYLTGPIEVTTIDARVPVAIEAEAKQKECDYVLYTTLTQKQGGGGFGGMLKKAGPLTSIVPYAGRATTAGVIATQTVISAATIASSIKAKDELTLEYKVVGVGTATQVVANTLKAKAKADGEDILSPLLEQMATAILSAKVNP